jgi:hypothetical protein
MEGQAVALLSLQLGAALVVSFAAQRRRSSGRPNWRIRALRAAAAAAIGSDAWGWTARDRRRVLVRLTVPVRRASARTPGG